MARPQPIAAALPLDDPAAQAALDDLAQDARLAGGAGRQVPETFPTGV